MSVPSSDLGQTLAMRKQIQQALQQPLYQREQKQGEHEENTGRLQTLLNDIDYAAV